MSGTHIATLLRQLRSHRELTQLQVAEKLHLSRQALSSYETGRTLPPLVELGRLALFYSIPVEIFLELIDVPSDSSIPVIDNNNFPIDCNDDINSQVTTEGMLFKNELISYSHFINTLEKCEKITNLTEGELFWIHLYHSIPPGKRIAIIRSIFVIIHELNSH